MFIHTFCLSICAASEQNKIKLNQGEAQFIKLLQITKCPTSRPITNINIKNSQETMMFFGHVPVVLKLWCVR